MRYIFLWFYAIEWDCYTAFIHLLLIWEASSAVTQLSCNVTGAFKKTRIWVGREETWVQAKFRPLMCFKTWNVLGFSFGLWGFFCFGVGLGFFGKGGEWKKLSLLESV